MSEPVAWISVLGIDHIGQKFTDVRVSLTKTDVADIPLYTSPQKELSDEEIIELWAKSHENGIAMQQGFTTQQHYFAYLLLKKASEK